MRELPRLNLPKFEYRLQKDEKGEFYIYDILRKKYILLYPEEWVRQHFVHFLIQHNYPKALMRVERAHRLHERLRRSDIICHDREGKPFLLVECKSPSVKITATTFEQVAIYNEVVGAPYLALTNGMQHYFLKHNREAKRYETLSEFPIYGT
ncbi:MAG: type I restriction enzyme HsdR N-terminal domain-containing protein [Bernardetiaceae bacterium]|nr:type I restriction enzyme HsdR N-terminal domain-containing protein [Bernardetiaceae bacterium]